MLFNPKTSADTIYIINLMQHMKEPLLFNDVELGSTFSL